MRYYLSKGYLALLLWCYICGIAIIGALIKTICETSDIWLNAVYIIAIIVIFSCLIALTCLIVRVKKLGIKRAKAIKGYNEATEEIHQLKTNHNHLKD